MINFVTEEQVIALKQLGFNEIILRYFDLNHNRQEITAPLQQQAIEWMLEKHHIYGWVEHYWYPLGHRWKACIKSFDGGKAQIAGELRSYEEAMDKCIDMLIEYVKD